LSTAKLLHSQYNQTEEGQGKVYEQIAFEMIDNCFDAIIGMQKNGKTMYMCS
jgi:hypothetical protein